MSSHRRGRNRSARIAVEPLEARELLTTIVALTAQDQLINFDSSLPSAVGGPTAISGLQPGESVLAIATRPATGQLYGLGSTGRLYAINPSSGVSRAIAPGPIAAPLSGGEFSMSFNPASDTLRIVSDTGEDLRVDPNTAAVTTDATLYYAPTDPNTGAAPDIIGEANSNNVPGATVSTTFGIDAAKGTLVRQGSLGGSPTPANLGELFTVGKLGVDAGTMAGFVVARDGQALAAFHPAGGSPSLYAINLATGAASLVGTIAKYSPILDIAALQPADVVYGVTTTDQLVSFSGSTPDQLLSSRPIAGLNAGESISSIAFRPANGGLYGLGTSGRVYLINLGLATATPLGAAPIYAASSPTAKASLSFDPTTDRFRVVDSGGVDLRGNPDSGALIARDPALSYAPTDPAAGIPPHVVAEAYANPVAGATATTLYGIDTFRDVLVTQGTAGVSPDSGLLYEVGPGSLGVATSDLDGLAFAADGTAYALLTPVSPQGTSTPTLALVDLKSGAAKAIGAINSAPLLGIAVQPAGVAEFSAPAYQVAPTSGSVVITVARIDGAGTSTHVNYATADGTAKAGVDYSPTSGTLDFDDGVTSETFVVPILNDAANPSPRTVLLSLTQVAGEIPIGPIGSATLTIAAGALPQPSGIVATTFGDLNGPLESTIDLTFAGAINAAQAVIPSNYTLLGSSKDPSINIISASYDATNHQVQLKTSALAPQDFLRITVGSVVTQAAPIAEDFTIRRGKTVRYTDGDGDHVTLSVSGKGAGLVLIQSANGEGLQAWVTGKCRVVTGGLRAIRGSNHKTTLQRIVTNGAKLRLPRAITVGQVMASD